MMTNDHVPRYNAERYSDPTARAAMQGMETDQDRVSDLVRRLKHDIKDAGFELIDRIKLRDPVTGKLFL